MISLKYSLQSAVNRRLCICLKIMRCGIKSKEFFVMLWNLVNDMHGPVFMTGMLIAAVLGFVLTVLILKRALLTLPKDQGRKFAVNGEISKGKPRGGGLVFVLIFIGLCLVFLELRVEYLITYGLIAAAMLTGYLDDNSKIPWGEWKKGLLDLVICVIAVITYCNFDGDYTLYFFGDAKLVLPPVLYMLIAVFFLWVSINVTNCTDGVDGLLGTLSVITMITLFLMTFSGFGSDLSHMLGFKYMCLFFAVILLGYLVFNASPSMLLMGDAGSRAIGLFIGIMVLHTHIPLIYFLICGVIFVDGGIGLVKLLVLRILKAKNFLKNVRTPLHDHARKNKGWSDTQVVTRFAILHVILCLAGFYLADIIDKS